MATSQAQTPGVRVSRGVVSIYKEVFGRGPTRARTYFNDDVVTVVLEDSLTGVENSLVEHGEEEMVSRMRDGFQAAVCDRLVDVVEAETGRTVKAFMSDHSVMPDYAVEIFVLGESGDTSPC